MARRAKPSVSPPTTKLLIAHKLDELGIDYIEGGWPGSNPKDKEFFARASDLKLKHARLVAFGATRFARKTVEEGRERQRADRSRTRRSCRFSARAGICTCIARSASPKKKTSQLIADTVRYLKAHGKEVVYDAEHFFDGYTANRDFALRTLEAAKKAGADVLVLCDTNGGTITQRLAQICADVRKQFRRRARHPHA